MLYFLQVELCHLDGDSPNRQEMMKLLDRFQMCFDQMSNGGSQPALRFSSIEKSARPIPSFAIPPRTAKLKACRKQLLFVAGTTVAQLQGKGNHLDHSGFTSLQQHPGLARSTGH